MKSPADLAARWARQWQLADTREQRLLHVGTWPISLPIGRPTPTEFAEETGRVRNHVQNWRGVATGVVIWATVNFRSGAEPVTVPVAWQLRSPAEWAAATFDAGIADELQRIEKLLAAVAPVFHRVVVRQWSLVRENSHAEVVAAAAVALKLAPGCAGGRPLRLLSAGRVDTKFFERHRGLVMALLDARFEGQVSDAGLEAFLGALEEGDHWLLVVPLGEGLLPFAQQRVRARELKGTRLPGANLLVVENETSLHQLPRALDTVAILGAGLNLDWLREEGLREKRIGYWGDVDTWGLQMLASARRAQPHVAALLMTREVFDMHAGVSAVVEPNPGAQDPPDGLTAEETALYAYLRTAERGRLEQEFLPDSAVRSAVERWVMDGGAAAG